MEQALALMRDSVWVFVGALLALALLIVAVIPLLRRRLVRCEVERPVLVLTKQERTEGAAPAALGTVPPLHAGADVYAVVVHVVNAGSHAVLVDNFQEPLRLRFGTGSFVLGASVVTTTGARFDAHVQVENGAVVLAPVLLNKRAGVRIKALVCYPGDVTVTGNIDDTPIRSVDVRRRRGWQAWRRALALYVLLQVVIIGARFVAPRVVVPAGGFISTIVGIEFVAMFFLALWAIR